MSALKWHLCDRLWEIKPPMRIVPDLRSESLDESAADSAADEVAVDGEGEGERVDRFPDPPPDVQFFWAS